MKRTEGRPPRLNPGFRAGFTLIEVVASICVVVFALAGVAGVLALALDQERQSRQETHMTHIASKIFADLQSRGSFEEGSSGGQPISSTQLLTAPVALNSPTTAYYSSDEELITPGGATPDYTVTAVITKAVAAPAGIYNVDLTITSAGKFTQTFVQTVGSF